MLEFQADIKSCQKICIVFRAMDIVSWFRHCAVCGSSLPPIQWICPSCFQQLKSYYLKPKYMLRLQSQFHHCRLADWTAENDFFIRRLLYSLKGKEGSPLFQLLAREFCTRIHHLSSIFIENNSAALVPCPPSQVHSFLRVFKSSPAVQKDHSWYWCQSLHYWTGYPVYPVLKAFPRRKAQKRKTLLERKPQLFMINESQQTPQNQTIVFTDDIVTSGATAQSAYQTLNCPKSFMIWSLFWRKRQDL